MVQRIHIYMFTFVQDTVLWEDEQVIYCTNISKHTRLLQYLSKNHDRHVLLFLVKDSSYELKRSIPCLLLPMCSCHLNNVRQLMSFIYQMFTNVYQYSTWTKVQIFAIFITVCTMPLSCGVALNPDCCILFNCTSRHRHHLRTGPARRCHLGLQPGWECPGSPGTCVDNKTYSKYNLIVALHAWHACVLYAAEHINAV